MTEIHKKKLIDLINSYQTWPEKRNAIFDYIEKEIEQPLWNAAGECYIPAEHIRICMVNAGGYVKAKVGNAKKSMKNVVAAMFMVEPDEIIIPNYDAIDKRSAVNKNIKARVIVLRPKWSTWGADFVLKVDNNTVTIETIIEILNNAGQYVGIGSYRPTNNGYFGRFELTNIQEIKDNDTPSNS